MFVTLKDGSVHNVNNEHDIADIVETYCGSELADLIRKSEYTELVRTCIDVQNILVRVHMENKSAEELEQNIEKALLLLQEVI